MFIVAALAAGLFAPAAFAEETTQVSPAKFQEMVRICESARLTDMERRECRAMFKTASSDEKMLVAYRVVDERINGSAK